ncbi:hypothetical protein ACJRO7_000633 [Eucalyptus globulus]|uniref:Uncharacterized protein n=1 Tax=Eucalyptus globulus TaxID=34317 RepID=A0ABD3LPG5_EUCGL
MWISDNGSCLVESLLKYLVFLAGPGTCLGKDVACVKAKSCPTAVLERFKIYMQDRDRCPELVLSLTIKDEGWAPREGEKEMYEGLLS